MFTSVFLTAMLVVIGLCALAANEWQHMKGRGPRAAASGGLLLAGVAAVWAAWAVAADKQPIASADLSPGRPALELDAGAMPPSLLVRGSLGVGGEGMAASGTYRVEVRDPEGHLLDRFEGDFEDHPSGGQSGYGPPGRSSDLEDRFDLSADTAGKRLLVSVVEETGGLVDALEVQALPAPPRAVWIGGLTLGATILGAIADRSASPIPSRSAIWAALLGSFGVALLDGVTPGSSPMAILGALIFAGLFGLPAGLLVRALVPGRRAPKQA